MSYDLLILAFIMLVFCFFMQILTVKVMISILNARREEGERKIEAIELFNVPKKKTAAQIKAEERARKEEEEYRAIMRNLDVFDGTGIGQEDI